MKKFFFAAMLAVAMFNVEAKTQKVTIDVDGKCEMCKTRIEKTAGAVPGVTSAKWNLKTKQLILIYDDQKTDVKKVEAALAAVGHDTQDIKASDEAYNKLHGCCKYREGKQAKPAK